MDLVTARQRLTDTRVGHLATVTADFRPHIVPCCLVLTASTLYSAVDAKPKTTHALRRLQNVQANPASSVIVDHYDEDWMTLWWIRVDGYGRVIESGDERDRAIDLLVEKYEQYRATPPPGPVLALDIEHWHTWP